MSVFLRCQHVGGRGTIRTTACDKDCTWHYQFKEAFGGPLMAKYGEKYTTFRKVQQGDTGHTHKQTAERHEEGLRKDMRRIKSGDDPVGPLKVKADQGVMVMKLSALLGLHEDWYPKNRAASSVGAALNACRQFTAFKGGDTFIHTITAQDFTDFKGHQVTQKTNRRAGTRTEAYINTQLMFIRGMFREAEVFCPGFRSPFTPVVIAGRRRCPISGFDIKKKPKPVPTEAEYADILARLPAPYDLIAQTQFETSARVGEVVTLKKGNIGLYADGQAGWFERQLKGGDTHRSDISADLARKLMASLKAQGPGAVFFFPHQSTPFRHLVISTVTARLRELFDAMGYDWMTSHKFRHKAIRTMLDRRVPEVDIALMTGWTSTKQIEEYKGDRTEATKTIGREQASLHQQMMAQAPVNVVKAKPQHKRHRQASQVLPFQKKGIA